MTNSSPWKITMLLMGKPSINGLNGPSKNHGYVTNYQRVNGDAMIAVWEYFWKIEVDN